MIPNLNTLFDYKIRVIPGNSVGYGVPGQGAPADGGFFEVQKITFSDAGEDAESDLTDSTFTLEIGEQETEELPCNAGYHVVQDALRTLTNMGQAHVNRNDYSDYTLTTSHADIKIEWLVTFIHEIPSGSIDVEGNYLDWISAQSLDLLLLTLPSKKSKAAVWTAWMNFPTSLCCFRRKRRLRQ